MRFFQKLLTKLLVLFSSIVIHSQEVDFHPPIDAPFNLSGTFGEFRSRFHTGIDFKGGEGINVFGSSALILHSIACPLNFTSFCLKDIG